MAYYECLSNNNDHINNGDKFTVILTGSHNLTTTATVCYIDKTTVCLLGDISLGNARLNPQLKYAWNYTVNINNKNYTGTCRIPTHEQIYSKCAGYKRDFHYWTSRKYDYRYWAVTNKGNVELHEDTTPYGTIPFIEITL